MIPLDRWMAEIADARCAHCGFPVDSGALCNVCVAVRPLRGARCGRCDGAVAEAVPRCGRCLRGFLPHLDTFRAASLYAGPYRTLVLRGKRSGRRDWIEATAPLVLATFSRDAIPVDAVVPVPMHGRRFAERGFNAAERVAAKLAAARALPLQLLLERIRHEDPLSAGKSPAARKEAVRGAFRVRTEAIVPESVCLVDDVMTTGATMSACARALRRSGAKAVHGWALLRAPDPASRA